MSGTQNRTDEADGGASEPAQWRPSTLLATVRENSRYHWLALVVACLVGLALATFHWSGIVLGGALVGVIAPDLKRATLSGVGFGLLVVLIWAGLIALSGTIGNVTAMNEMAVLPAGIALSLAVLGSLFRGALS